MMKQGVGFLIALVDLTDAFKHILIHAEDWLLLPWLTMGSRTTLRDQA